ncbi:MAG: S8 family serine peptidase, partial [Betaproteobacteria bacterium]|nr:S8 family serine peptidase [Betaproteobacteria bacterium]
MQSSKQIMQFIASAPIPFSKLKLPPLEIPSTQPIPALIQAGLLGLAMLFSAVSYSAPPDQASSSLNLSSSEIQSAKNSHSKNSNEKWAKGRILVMPRAGLPEHTFREVLKEHNGKARKMGQSGLYVVSVAEDSEEAVVTALQQNPHLKFADLDHIVFPNMIPNDPYYANEWHLAKIGAPTAWDIAQGTGITIAILDSGVAANHPDLTSNMTSGWNFYDNNSITLDITGHGTIVAGSAAAAINNSTGVAGVSGLSKIMPLRITDTAGYGYESTISQGLIYAADNGARVANVSFEGVSNLSSIRNAAQYMKNKNGLVVVSAGNTGKLESFTTTTSLIPVSSTNQYDAIDSSYGDYVSLSAPGVNIWSTNDNSAALYGPFSGSSFASPIAGAVIALMMSANPQLGSVDI